MKLKKYYTLLIISSFLLLILDQITKFVTRKSLLLGEEKVVIPHFFSITYLQNTGAAWSFMEGNSYFFLIIAIISITIFIYVLIKYHNRLIILGTILMLTGTIGNLIDRIINGFVTDMIKIDFINFPIFNVADMCLTIGVITLLFALLKEE